MVRAFPPQPDDEPVWQAGNGKSGIPDKALLYADLIRTAGGKDTDAGGLDFNPVYTAVFACDGEDLW